MVMNTHRQVLKFNKQQLQLGLIIRTTQFELSGACRCARRNSLYWVIVAPCSRSLQGLSIFCTTNKHTALVKCAEKSHNSIKWKLVATLFIFCYVDAWLYYRRAQLESMLETSCFELGNVPGCEWCMSRFSDRVLVTWLEQQTCHLG